VCSYGEKGSVIIQKMLLHIFSTVDLTLAHPIKPMSLAMFTQHIVVPHVATNLIAQDKKCSLDEAFQIMRDSGEYGYERFCDTDDDPDYEEAQQECVRLARACQQ
jgi:hypothetical protein